MDDEVRRALLRLVAQLMLAPHAYRESPAWSDALDLLDADEVDEAIEEVVEAMHGIDD